MRDLPQPVISSASIMLNEGDPLTAAALEPAIWQWLISQQALASPAPVADGPSIPSISPADVHPDASLWDEPFAPSVLGF